MTRCARCSGDLLDLTVFCPHCGHPREPQFDRLLNCSLSGRYLIHEHLGEGGLSTVFIATDLHTDQTVVVKISDPRQLVRNSPGEAFDQKALRNYWSEMLQRMRREVVALVNLLHPNIVRIFDTDLITDELRYIVMEHLQGHTLREELSERGRFSVRETIRLAEAVADGLSAVHARGIIHRDLNPRNLFLCETAADTKLQGLRIIDFGIARIPQPPGNPPFTQYAVLSGTVSYASPEQCQNLTIDHRSDIYSLGVVLYEMLTGQRPFTGLTPTEIAVKQIRDEPVSPRLLVPDLPAGVETAILRALAKDPNRRPQTVEEFAADLRPHRDGVSARVVVPLSARPESLATILSSLPELPEPASASPAEPEPVIAALPDTEVSPVEITSADAADHSFAALQRTDARRRRRVLAVAAMLVLLLAAGALYGAQVWSSLQPYIASTLPGLTQHQEAASETLKVTPSVSPDATQAVQSNQTLPQRNVAAGSVAPDKQSNSAASAAQQPSFARRLGEKLMALVTTARPTPTATPAPQVRPPAAAPQMPPVPAPTILVSRDPQPQSNPAESRGPVRETAPENNEPAWSPSGSGQRERQGYPSARHEQNHDEVAQDVPAPAPSRPEIQREPRNNDRPWNQPDYRGTDSRRDDRSDEADQPLVDMSPKVISWSGEVNQEREIRLELPGVPGNINIPRQYRRRVGMVEPPGPHNRWRSVVLRVFGNGRTSIVVQWWPTSRQFTRSAGNFINRQVIARFGQTTRAVTEQFARIRK
ncbi:MAG: serine/threonine-protein kinase [Blastocatellia bacterium]